MTFYWEKAGNEVSGLVDFSGFGVLQGPQRTDIPVRLLMNNIVADPKKSRKAVEDGFDDNFKYFLNHVVSYTRPGARFGDIRIVLKNLPPKSSGRLMYNQLRWIGGASVTPNYYKDLTTLMERLRFLERHSLVIIVLDGLMTKPIPTPAEIAKLIEIGRYIQTKNADWLPVILTDRHEVFPSLYKDFQDQILGRPIVTIVKNWKTESHFLNIKEGPRSRPKQEAGFRVWDRRRLVVGYEVTVRPDHQDLVLGYGINGTKTTPIDFETFYPKSPFGFLKIWYLASSWAFRPELLCFTSYALAIVGLKRNPDAKIDPVKEPKVGKLISAINSPDVGVPMAIQNAGLADNEEALAYFLVNVMEMHGIKPQKAELLTIVASQLLNVHNHLGAGYPFDAFEQTIVFKKKVLSDPFGNGLDFYHYPTGMNVTIAGTNTYDSATWTPAPKAPKAELLDPTHIKIEYREPNSRGFQVDELDDNTTRITLV